MKKLQYLFMSLAALLLATPAFAQGAAGSASAAAQWVPLAAGLGMALASGLCGIGQGRATASATEALARNPGARPGIFIFLILGLAFIRVPRAVYVRDHLHQGCPVELDGVREASASAEAFLRSGVDVHGPPFPRTFFAQSLRRKRVRSGLRFGCFG